MMLTQSIKKFFLIIVPAFCVVQLSCSMATTTKITSTKVTAQQIHAELIKIDQIVTEFLNSQALEDVPIVLSDLFFQPLSDRSDAIGNIAKSCNLLTTPIINFAMTDDTIVGRKVCECPAELQDRFKTDFLQIASTPSGKKLLKELLINILLKIPSQKKPFKFWVFPK